LDLSTVQNNAKKLRKTLRKFADPPSPDAVHKLRTRIRQFESAVQTFGNGFEQAETKGLKEMEKIRKKAGKVRDLDVFTSHLASLHSVGEDECLVQFLLHIGAKRRKQASRLASVVQKEAASLRKRIKRAVKEFESRAGKKMTRPSEDTTQQINAVRAQRFIEAAQAPQLDRKNLHEYRKKIKVLRDVLLIAHTNSDGALVKALRQSKDAIGEWHDWEELAAIGGKVLEDHQKCKLLAALKDRTQKKFQEALRATTKMRRRYLKVTAPAAVLANRP
jgi:CHAD domain-containing protein